VERAKVQQFTTTNNIDNTTSINGGTSATNSVEQQSTRQPVTGDPNSEGGASSSSSTTTSGISTLSTDTSNSSLHNHIEEVPVVEKPKFFFTPVNRFGHTEGARLEDTGMSI